MRRIRETFETVEIRPTKSVKCSECGKRLTRRGHFFQTLNPWNIVKRGPGKGKPKNVAEILCELHLEAAKWQKEPETCRDCDTRLIR